MPVQSVNLSTVRMVASSVGDGSAMGDARDLSWQQPHVPAA